MKKYTRIVGTGGYLPPHTLSNEDLASAYRLETTHEWIIQRTGIASRHIAGPQETCASMAEHAAKQALEAAHLSPDAIDFILVATSTPDCSLPGVACSLQEKLGIAGCPALDINAACSGFVYGLSIADQYIKNGAAKTVLFVGTEIMSRLVNWKDRKTCILFGDGAGAVVLQASDTAGILSTHLHADGRFKNLLFAPHPLASHSCEKISENLGTIYMEGQEIFRLAVNHLSQLVDETLSAHQMTPSMIDWLIPHQANQRIIQAIAKKLDMPLDKVILTVEQQANTSAASIPLALHQGVLDGRIQKGHTLLLEAFGAGLSWGSALVIF